MNVKIFTAIGELATGAKKRRDGEHQEFLGFFRSIVETIPTEVVQIFGTLSGIEMRLPSGKVESYGIELTATDYMWWKQKIEKEGARFVGKTSAVQSNMLDRLGKKAEMHRLEPAERKKLIALLEEAAV